MKTEKYEITLADNGYIVKMTDVSGAITIRVFNTKLDAISDIASYWFDECHANGSVEVNAEINV